MNNLLSKTLPLWITAIVLLSVTGCTFHVTKKISEKLNTDTLNASYNVTPIDLSLKSNCPKPPTVKIINIESRTEEYKAMIIPPDSGVINPKEMMDAVALHLADGYNQSHISLDDQSTKVLEIRMIDLMAAKAGVWSFGSHFKMDIIIPEIEFTKTYESNEGSGIAPNAIANAIHVVIRKIIDDPLIQNYILCNTEYSGALSVQKEGASLHHKLQELQTSFDKGLISEKEYQLKRKDILEKF